jgi:hypothetical protein
MTKQINNLKIDPELKDLFPPLTPDEYSQLEQNIKKDGCQNPLFIWHGYIADGHNRYKICTENKIPYKTVEINFSTKEEVIQWMINTQLGRRNLTPMQRIAITEKYRPVLEIKAKQNLSKAGQSFSPKEGSANLPKVDTPINTRIELAKLAGVGERTYGKATAILNSNNEIIKQVVLKNEKSIDAGYKEIKGDSKSKGIKTSENLISLINKCKIQVDGIKQLDIYRNLDNSDREKVIDSLLTLGENINEILNSNLLTSIENPTGILSINDIRKKVEYKTTDDCDLAISQLEAQQQCINEEKEKIYRIRQQLYNKSSNDDLHCIVKEIGKETLVDHKFVFYLVKHGNKNKILDIYDSILIDNDTDLIYRKIEIIQLSKNEKSILLAKILEIRNEYKKRIKEKGTEWEQFAKKFTESFNSYNCSKINNGNPMIKEIIDSGYRTLAKKYHPDLTNDDGKQMQVINEAKDILDKSFSTNI